MTYQRKCRLEKSFRIQKYSSLGQEIVSHRHLKGSLLKMKNENENSVGGITVIKLNMMVSFKNIRSK
ncbi:hypothetical protein H5410_038949 [Solanum commersonii]|uniref:Uncharacterized protein n=1 Tax=Solanum commersonii TaxID=4109 RepID=A0A9J5YC65_SOLCO|nr:hypothetical protein H5410_038949 [Solanum commersonii]